MSWPPIPFEQRRQPYADPERIGPTNWMKPAPVWLAPYIEPPPPIPAFSCNCMGADCWRDGCVIRRRATERIANRRAMVLRAEDV